MGTGLTVHLSLNISVSDQEYLQDKNSHTFATTMNKKRIQKSVISHGWGLKVVWQNILSLPTHVLHAKKPNKEYNIETDQ